MAEEKDSKSDEENKGSQKKKTTERNLFIAIVIIVGAIALFLSFSGNDSDDVYTFEEKYNDVIQGEADESVGYMYNGFGFVRHNGMWRTFIKIDDTKVKVPLHYGPKDVENISVEGSVDERFNKDKVYVTFDPNATPMKYVTLSASELSLNLARGLKIEPMAACTTNTSESCKERPTITCDNTNAPVIYLKETDDEGKVIKKDNCVVARGNEKELVKAVDRLLLELYQIMD